MISRVKFTRARSLTALGLAAAALAVGGWRLYVTSTGAGTRGAPAIESGAADPRDAQSAARPPTAAPPPAATMAAAGNPAAAGAPPPARGVDAHAPAGAGPAHDEQGGAPDTGGTKPARRKWTPDELDRWADRRPGDRLALALPDGSTAAAFLKQLRVKEGLVLYVAGTIGEPEEGRFFFQRQTVEGIAGAFVGVVEFPRRGTAFRLEPAPDGGTELVARPLTDVKCIGMPPPSQTANHLPPITDEALKPNPEGAPVPQTPDYQGGIPALESLPGSAGVIYLDFDGEYTPTWGGIDAAPSGMSSASISDCWRRVSADFLPYNINVTTDRRIFDSAAEGRRQHVVFTPTDDAAPGAGGVAYIGSWNWSGDTPCWVFVLSADSGGEAASHEVGHTLQLGHDGQTNNVEYYGGHGSGEFNWAPIMGVGYGAYISQWCKGEYAMANNRQDDLAIIDSNNSVNYRADDHGSNRVTASWLELFSGSRVTNEGIITRNTDVDAFKFATAGGAVDLTIGTVMAEKQIAYVAYLTDTNDAIVGTFDSTTSLAVRVVTNLAAGDYVLRVQGDGRNNPTNAFSNYASLGYYRITGTLAGGEQPRRFTIAENPTNGQVVGTITNNSPADPHVYRITGGNTGTAFAVASNGVLTVASTNPINYEVREQIDLLVTISNTANPALDETGVRVVVHITNVNEPPAFQAAGPFVTFEGTERGAFIGTVRATDPDDYTRLNYSIAAGNSNNTFAIDDQGVLSVTNTVVRPANTNFSLLLRAVDQAGAGARTGTLTVVVNVLSNVAPTANGGLAYSFFGNLGGSTALSGLTNNARWPHDPDYVTILPAAEAPTDQAENFGAVMRAWLQVPHSGSYRFAVAGDDAFELRLSTNGAPSNAVRIAYSDNWTNPREWTTYASQRSALFNLQVGQLYYIEARMKEGAGGDNLAIGWSNATMGVSDYVVIEGQYLAPYFIDALPPPWQARDIGDVGSPGLASFHNGRFTVSGSGADIWSTNDQFQFASLPFAGDGTLSARVDELLATHPAAKSGVMFRETLLSNAPCFAVVMTPSNGVRMQYRTTTGGTTANAFVTNIVVPAWVRATRAGQSFRGYYSTNGETWTQIGSAQTLTMASPLEAGLAVTAHDNTETNITTFANVSALPPGFADRDIGAPGAPGGSWYSHNLGSWTVLGGGSDIYGGTDRFHFVSAPAAGDCTVTARVLSVQRTDANAKAGVMLRDTTASNAAYAFAFATPTNVWFQYRTNTAAATAAGNFVNIAAPIWLKLTRGGNVCSAYYSTNGANWTQLGSSRTVNLSPLASAGLAVTSHNNLTNCMAGFEGFAITPSERNFVWTNAPGGPWSDGPGWTNLVAPNPGGTRDYALVFAASSHCVVTNDLGSVTNGGFHLNFLAITQSAAVIHGSNLVFRSTSSNVAPVLWNTTTGSVINAGLTLSDSTTLSGNSGQSLTLNGAVGGTGMLTKSGNMTLALASANSHGVTRITAGTLQLTASGTFGADHVTNNGTIAFNRTGAYAIANAIHGTGGIQKNTDNNGTVMLDGTNTFTGGVNINNGSITIRNSQSLGLGNKTVSVNNGSAGNANIRLDGSGGDIVMGTNIAWFSSNANGVFFNMAGSNTLLGNFTLASGGGSTVLVVPTGRLTCAGNFTPNTTGRSLNLRGNGDGEVSGVIADGVGFGSLPLYKELGAGTWTLSGTNTYTGPTAVNSGTLIIDGSIDTGAVTVASGATLGGSGTIGGPVTSSGFVAPGGSPGVLTLANGYTQNAGGTLRIEIGGTTPDTQHDRLLVSNTAAIGGALTVVLTNGFMPAVGDRFVILQSASLGGKTFATTNLPPIGTNRWTVAYAGSTSVVLSVVAAPAGYDAFSNAFALALGPGGDDDGDGHANLLEYVTGGNPTNVDNRSGLAATMMTNGLFALRFTRATNATDATLYVQGSFAATNDAVWQSIAINSNGRWAGAASVTETGASPVTVTVGDISPVATNRYLRLRVTRP